MTVTIKFFAMIREKLGVAQTEIEVPAGSTVGDIRSHVEAMAEDIAPLLERSMIMRNQEYADLDDPVEDGDEIAVIPPVSGGDHFRVHPDQLDPAAVAGHVTDPGAGAVVTFTGVVRDNARGRRVTALDYEAYPAAAEKQLANIAAEIRERWPVLSVAIEHRTGKLDIGEASVVIAISSAHREPAFEASAYAIRRIKEIVPIWKKEFYDDGDAWIGSEHDYQVETGRIESSPGSDWQRRAREDPRGKG